MAVPDSVSIHNLSGTYNLNKQLSDPSDAVLQMQGIGWLVRKAISFSNVTLHVKQYVDQANLEHIDIETVTTGNIRNIEERIFDFELREKHDKVFGKVQGRTRYVKLDEVGDDYLKQGFILPEDGQVVQSCTNSVGKNPDWAVEQIWGFEVVDGLKRHTRRIVAKKGEEEHKIRLVYDWVVCQDEDADLAY